MPVPRYIYIYMIRVSYITLGYDIMCVLVRHLARASGPPPFYVSKDNGLLLGIVWVAACYRQWARLFNGGRHP